MKNINKLIIGIMIMLSLVFTVNAAVTPSSNLNGYNQFTISNYKSIEGTNATFDRINNEIQVNDMTGTGIRNAIALCDGINICKVKLVDGVYDVGTHITMKNNVILEGNGDSSILNISSDGLGTLFRQSAAGLDFVELSNFHLKNNNRTSGIGIDFRSGIYDLTIKNVHISDITSAMSVKTEKGTIINNYVDNANWGIDVSMNETFSNQSKLLISGNYFINRDYYSSDPLEYGEGIEVNLHYFDDSTAIITNNRISGYREEGIDCNAKNCIITNNNIVAVNDETRTNNGITVSHSPEFTGEVNNTGTISNNIITNIGNSSDSAGVSIRDTKGFTISNNYFEGTGGDGLGIKLLTGTEYNILGNTFYNLGTGLQSRLESIAPLNRISNAYSNVTLNYHAFNSPKNTMSLDYNDYNLGYLQTSFSNLYGVNNQATQTMLTLNNTKPVEGAKMYSDGTSSTSLGLYSSDSSKWTILHTPSGAIYVSPYDTISTTKSIGWIGSSSSADWTWVLDHQSVGKRFDLRLIDGNLDMDTGSINVNGGAISINNTPAQCSLVNTFTTEWSGDSQTCTAINETAFNTLTTVGNITAGQNFISGSSVGITQNLILSATCNVSVTGGIITSIMGCS